MKSSDRPLAAAVRPDYSREFLARHDLPDENPVRRKRSFASSSSSSSSIASCRRVAVQWRDLFALSIISGETVNHEATINSRRLIGAGYALMKEQSLAVTSAQLFSPNAYFRNAPRGIRRPCIREMKSRAGALLNFKCCIRN